MQLEDCTKEELIFLIRSSLYVFDFDSLRQMQVLSRRAEKISKQATEALNRSTEFAKLGDVAASAGAWEKYRKLSDKETKIMKEMEKLTE